jgi:peptidyl-prolyl cis-trans isomerase D
VLKFIRRNASGAWVKVMFVAIVVVFVFWGVGSVVRGAKVEMVARVNDDVIQPPDFFRAYNNLLRAYEDVYKDHFNPDLLKMLDLKGRTVDQLIQTHLLRQEAERMGLRTSENEVRDAIAAMPVFQQDGRFNKELYLNVLRANNLTPGEFEEAEQEELLVRKLQDIIFTGVNVSEADVHDQYRLQNEKVNLRFLKFEPAEFLADVQVSDAEVQAYYDGHKDEFREPERVRIEYVLYTPDAFADKVEVSDAEIQQYYDAHQAQYTTPEHVHVRHILFKVAPTADAAAKAEARKRAEDVLAKVKAGEDFATLARQYSQDASAAQGGDLGSVSRGQMVKPFEDAAFALAPGTTSDIVESPFGLHIIKVESKQEAATRPLSEVHDEVVKALRQQKARDAAQAQANQVQQKVAGGESLASASGQSVVSPPPFARGEPIQGVGLVNELATAALAAKAGETGPVVSSPKGFFVFRVTERIDSSLPELAAIRARVATAARKEKATALAHTKAEEARAAVKPATLDTVAAQYKVKVEETGPFTRLASTVPKIGNAPEIQKAAFRLTPESPVAPQVYSVGDATFVVLLEERVPADDAKFAADKQTLLRQAEERRKGEVMQEFVNHLRAQAVVEIDEGFLAKVSETGHALEGGPRRR